MSAVRAPVERLRGELEALERAYSPGHHGLWAARRRAGLVDATLREIVERAGAPPGVALAAVGGFGRAILLPRSDLDLLLVHDGSDREGVARLADAFLYPLWDTGFEVGHAVRTPAECEEACERLDAGAAMLDLRHVAGDPEVTAEARRRVEGWARGDPGGFVRRIEEDADRRAERAGSAAHLLEPDLKDGAGGWRDLHAISLVETALGRSLEDAGLLRGREREALAAAEEFLARVRSALHLETGRRTDRLVLELQPAIARAMGFEDEPAALAGDALMRALFEHTRQVDHLLRSVIDRDRSGVAAPSAAPSSPAEVLAALAVEAEADRSPSPGLLDAIEEADVPDPVTWNTDVLDGFVRLLRAGDRGAASIETLDRLGLLSRFLPEWTSIRCRPQRDPYHRFTVDTHLLQTLRGMGRILDGTDGDDPLLDEVRDQVRDEDGLLLGALLHDIGKTGEGRHVPVGIRLADVALARMGVGAPTRDLARFLVAEHLVLPDTATRRDLTEENLILDVAARAGSPDRLAALYLLAKADAEATGPAAWTSWRQTLIRELVAKVQRVLERGDMGEEIADRLAERHGRLRSLLSGEPADEVDRFLRRMPRSYLLATEPATASRHFATIAPGVGATEVRAVHHPGARPGTVELLVVARDRRGLLSWIAGSLALAGLSVLTAQVFTTDDGVAADVFEVEGVWERDVPERRWREFRGTLRRAIEGSISLDRRVDEKRRWYPAPRVPTPATVTVSNEVSDFSTVVEVAGPDRLGLLYDVTRTFAELDLDVHLAKVATYDGRVVDAFYVRDALGRKLGEGIEQLERVLVAAVTRASG